MKHRTLLSMLPILPLMAAACSSVPTSLATMKDQPATPATPATVQQQPATVQQEQEEEESVVVGQTTREQILAAVPDWAQAEAESRPDAATAQALATVEPGAEIDVFLGTWCGDSRREVPRFWRALDLAGPAVPFEVHYIGVDEDKKEPSAPVTNNGIQYVPTFIVRRNGQEVGRIVEDAPGGIEKDLLSLLTGQSKGLISSRSELQSPGSPPPQPPR